MAKPSYALFPLVTLPYWDNHHSELRDRGLSTSYRYLWESNWNWRTECHWWALVVVRVLLGCFLRTYCRKGERPHMYIWHCLIQVELHHEADYPLVPYASPSISSLVVCILRKCICSQPAANPGGATRPPAFFDSGNGDLLQPSGSLGIGKGLQHMWWGAFVVVHYRCCQNFQIQAI